MRVLIVDNAFEVTKELQSCLPPSFAEVACSDNYQYLMIDLGKYRPDVLVVVEAFVLSDGGRSLIELKKIPEYRYAPILIVLAGSEEKVVGLGLDKIASFCVRPVPALMLQELLKVMLRAKLLAERYDSKIVELEQLAMLDPIVALYNKKYFIMRLDSEIKKSRRHGDLFSVLLVRVKGLEAIVEAYGSKLYERILVDLAKRLKPLVRGSDILCKVAGDLFGIILVNVQPNGGEVVMKKLRGHLGNCTVAYNAREVPVSCGFSVVTYDPKQPPQGKILALALEALARDSR